MPSSKIQLDFYYKHNFRGYSITSNLCNYVNTVNHITNFSSEKYVILIFMLKMTKVA